MVLGLVLVLGAGAGAGFSVGVGVGVGISVRVRVDVCDWVGGAEGASRVQQEPDHGCGGFERERRADLATDARGVQRGIPQGVRGLQVRRLIQEREPRRVAREGHGDAGQQRAHAVVLPDAPEAPGALAAEHHRRRGGGFDERGDHRLDDAGATELEGRRGTGGLAVALAKWGRLWGWGRIGELRCARESRGEGRGAQGGWSP